MYWDIKVKWTGEYPHLCHGQWLIMVNDKNLNNLENDHFQTKNIYQSWHFDDDDLEYTEPYTDGLDKLSWIEFVQAFDINGLKKSLSEAGFNADREILGALYDEIVKWDFRPYSCGGCI